MNESANRRLMGKVALVTGAGRGIGRAIAEMFEREGATVIATARGAAHNLGPAVNYQQLDVASEAGWQSVVAGVVASHGRLDVLVNNAGIIGYEAPHELTLDSWNDVVATNQTGVWLGMREVIPSMQSGGGGSIINVSSIWGSVAVAGAHAYHASKGAVLNMSKNAAITYAQNNIRVNSLVPGFIETPLTDGQADEINKAVIANTPLGRAGATDEIAYGALFLASDESSFVTGAELVIDGGYLAQ
ncbi:SDR family oxidoreductase [Rhodococcus sp. IEGM 1366]|uniref:SDR family NAD(P)-dependent oxidoreductase n=1 Tax=Rhodococcus sp. IEGM 1366 TaxID=3082223 RepID=UPI002953B122|nr:SDR family oxidoreductase [Rhodococcus sp. IEGM 1366]MDV8070758.1 SDR family oxidoreductase [Rhodococcus sp. IEGM 1366]